MNAEEVLAELEALRNPWATKALISRITGVDLTSPRNIPLLECFEHWGKSHKHDLPIYDGNLVHRHRFQQFLYAMDLISLRTAGSIYAMTGDTYRRLIDWLQSQQTLTPLQGYWGEVLSAPSLSIIRRALSISDYDSDIGWKAPLTCAWDQYVVNTHQELHSRTGCLCYTILCSAPDLPVHMAQTYDSVTGLPLCHKHHQWIQTGLPLYLPHDVVSVYLYKEHEAIFDKNTPAFWHQEE